MASDNLPCVPACRVCVQAGTCTSRESLGSAVISERYDAAVAADRAVAEAFRERVRRNGKRGRGPYDKNYYVLACGKGKVHVAYGWPEFDKDGMVCLFCEECDRVRPRLRRAKLGEATRFYSRQKERLF